MEQWIEGAGAELVSVSSKFLDKPETEDRTLGSVVQNMQPDQAAIKIPICWISPPMFPSFGISLSKFDITRFPPRVKITFRYSA